VKPVTGGKRRWLVNNIVNPAGAVPEFTQRRVLHIVFASTSGHTEYVVDALIDCLKNTIPGWEIEERLLHDKAKTLDLAGKLCACIGLGDHRYFYTARAPDHLEHYVEAHHGQLIVPTLKIIDEPYGQEDTVEVWGKQLVDVLKPADRC
jgi:flavodoxin I